MYGVKEFYESIGGDYGAVSRRLADDARIRRFLGMFQRDQNFAQLSGALEKEDADMAFEAAHALKGMAANLAFTEFLEVLSGLTEELRNGQCTPRAKQLFAQAQEQYGRISSGISTLCG